MIRIFNYVLTFFSPPLPFSPVIGIPIQRSEARALTPRMGASKHGVYYMVCVHVGTVVCCSERAVIIYFTSGISMT